MALSLWQAGLESAQESFARDQLMMMLAAERGQPLARLWRRPARALCLGRYKRRPAAAPAALERRWSGGRTVPLGPRVAVMTLVLPTVDHLAPGQDPLRPDQVLNRALRPLLAALTRVGCDAFYGGRDLVTVAGATVAHASFGVGADGVCLVEQHVALSESFAVLDELVGEYDPGGVALIDRGDFVGARALAELSPALGQSDWEGIWAEEVGRIWPLDGQPGGLSAWCRDGSLVAAAESAYQAFLAERGPPGEVERSVVDRTMLGTVEVSARIDGQRVRDLLVSGDLMAPFHTLDELSARLEDKRPEEALVRRVMTSVMSGPRNFLLGAPEIGALIARLG